MFRKSKAIMFAVLVLGMCCITSFESAAAEYTVNSSHSEPTADEQSGYMNILVDNPTKGQMLYTIVWNIVPIKQNASFDRLGKTQMDIYVNQSSVDFRAINTGETAKIGPL